MTSAHNNLGATKLPDRYDSLCRTYQHNYFTSTNDSLKPLSRSTLLCTACSNTLE